MTLLAVSYELLKHGAIIGLARNCSIAILVYDDESVLLCEVVALPELTLNGFLTLVMT